ncbi:MAG: hypothetical protein L0Z51_10665 [Candidatus Latescibacteria bacterium]|nr:hypothetical protein [Candidatus Latescibacterota bacterium]
MRIFTLALLAIGMSALAVSAPDVVVLDGTAAPLVEHFNARSERLRFVAILSPT